ncbi:MULTISPECIES: RnfABCDGE type electron transport complex subunit G [Romboutsia]|uniref:Ion-translocating oxidoreductase complex subunit G n=1 Tax=Romboutsia hominis TaxID=1507512 RepID=A0A2P2BNS6_9FIRM|nr:MULTISPECIES: RnfABCDGE type electron transport complex subunit G [Romboutsia]MCH1959311.1 RnfABCDGE type electron transport complex subunit G [Romboutsia hominis]MCH1970209.1 RnfABCDGE type electron transport complex subunit G [Romboutsia hominis]MDB8790203.1 RnfABCDGE type electron transport complex subunit G [Romboutsia sp. 1001216sp1]MDB8792150.1 RnfABCDGE type electron transport complex subunit G [Romboutsia sp. 1001216sp1]MDB8797117.1 RnfABCDGE type electron transport complex subunit 
MKNILRLGAILFTICAVAALALGFINQITAPIIEDRNIQANNELRQLVLEDATEFKQLDKKVIENIDGLEEGIVSEVYEGISGSDVVGYTIKTLPSGYGGVMEVIVGISKDGKITGVNIGNMAETPGLGTKANEPNFKGQFSEKEAKELSVVKGSATSDNQIAAISGATITSEAVTRGVNAAIKVFNESLNK